MKNWKTALLGIITAVGMIANSAVENRRINPNAPPITIGNLWPGIAMAIFGMLSKDHDVTGGTRKNEPDNPRVSQGPETGS